MPLLYLLTTPIDLDLECETQLAGANIAQFPSFSQLSLLIARISLQHLSVALDRK